MQTRMQHAWQQPRAPTSLPAAPQQHAPPTISSRPGCSPHCAATSSSSRLSGLTNRNSRVRTSLNSGRHASPMSEKKAVTLQADAQGARVCVCMPAAGFNMCWWCRSGDVSAAAAAHTAVRLVLHAVCVGAAAGHRRQRHSASLPPAGPRAPGLCVARDESNLDVAGREQFQQLEQPSLCRHALRRFGLDFENDIHGRLYPCRVLPGLHDREQVADRDAWQFWQGRECKAAARAQSGWVWVRIGVRAGVCRGCRASAGSMRAECCKTRVCIERAPVRLRMSAKSMCASVSVPSMSKMICGCRRRA